MRRRPQVLIAHGADVNARTNPLERSKDRFGLEGVLTILAARQLDASDVRGAAGIARNGPRAGGCWCDDLNLTDPDGTTALVLAIINGHYDTAAMLTEKGADPNIADTAGMAALYAAVDMNTLGEVYGRPDRPSSDKLTALDLMKVLLAHGANPNAALFTPTLQARAYSGRRQFERGHYAADARGQEWRHRGYSFTAGAWRRRQCAAEERDDTADVRRGPWIWHGYFCDRLRNPG